MLEVGTEKEGIWIQTKEKKIKGMCQMFSLFQEGYKTESYFISYAIIEEIFIQVLYVLKSQELHAK